MRISVTMPDCVSRLELVEAEWVYADDDLDVFRLTRDVLKKSRPLLSAEVFQQAALDLQKSFVDWVDEYMNMSPPHYWLATPLSKNPFESHLFLHLVWMTLIDRAVKQGKNEIIVVTGSYGLALALAELCRVHAWEYQCYGKTSCLLRHWRRNLVALARWLGRLSLLGYRMIVARRVFTKEYVTNRLAAIELLLETYIHDGDIGENGNCKDRYFPGLMAYYRSQGVKAAYFPLLYHIPFWRLRKTFAAMKRGEAPFVPFEAFITFQDLVLASWMSMRHGLSFLLQTPLVFHDVPVSLLVRTECFTAGLRGAIPLALERTPRRMANAGINPKWFIDWFENQALDKGIVLGIKEVLPECRTIAVRQYVALSNFLSLFSSSGEVKAGVAPAENWVCGEALKPTISRFDSVGKYSVVPALRYSHLHQPTTADKKGDTLLVLLTHSMGESTNIIDCIAPLCREEGMGITRFVLKTHQDINLAQFQKKVEQTFPSMKIKAIEWTDRKMDELLPAAKVVVTSGSSSAVEAVCRGIPVVLIGRQAGLNCNPLEGIDPKMWAIAYTTDDLREAISERFCEAKLPAMERFAIAESTRRSFFMETGNDKMRYFFPTERR